MPVVKREFNWKWICLCVCLAGLIYWDCTQLSDYCSDGNKYNPGTQFCREGLAYPLCGGKEYEPAFQGCPHGDVILPRCGQNFYYEDEACYTDPETGVQRIHKRCAGRFDPVEWTCDGVELDPICDGKVYNPDVDFCFNNVPQMKCGGVTGYDPNTQFCGGDNRVYEKCGGEEYDPRYPSPCAAVADTRPMCGEERYDAGVQFCRDERLYVLCDGREYEPAAGETCYNEIRGPEVTPDATYALTVTAEPPGTGEVTIEPNKAAYEDGEPVTVTAVASEGYRFAGWTGSLESAEATMAFNMTRNMSLVANFAADTGPAVPDPPGAPMNVVALAVSSSGITVSWDAVAGDVRYVVHRGASEGGPYVTADSMLTETSYTNTGLSASTTYYYRVAAQNAAGAMGAWSAVVFATTQGGQTVVYGDTLIDGRDFQIYRTVAIGNQVWMAQNLNYDVPGGDSWCYGEGGYDYVSGTTLSDAQVQANCDTYGRLYQWSGAMALPSTCNSSSCSDQIQSPHQGVCPANWHVPTYDEWMALFEAVGGQSTAGTKLKASSPDWNGTDDYEFSALPGGSRSLDGSFSDLGSLGVWWTATELGVDIAYNWRMYTVNEYVNYGSYDKEDGYSVRCVQD